MTELEDTGDATISPLQEQINSMQQLMSQQLHLMQLQMQNATTNGVATLQPQAASTTIKRVIIPSGRYYMNSHELRTYTKDCTDFKKLTACTDEQAVLQMRMNMDESLKQAIDANYGNTWDALTLQDALTAIRTLVKHTTNPIV